MQQAASKVSRGEDSRRELMKIAIDCFAKYGYQSTSVDRIAKAAGVTKGALYYHFKDKEDLLFEAVRNRIGQFERRVASDVVAETRDAATSLRQVAQACLEHATKSNHRRFIVTLMVEALDTNDRLSHQFRAMMNRFRQYLIDIIRAGEKSGRFRQGIDATLAAQTYSAAIMGAEIQYYQDPENVDLGRILEAFLEQFIVSLSA
jgi:TetR/AcrR family transcriptional regulator, acrAB operon repressor